MNAVMRGPFSTDRRRCGARATDGSLRGVARGPRRRCAESRCEACGSQRNRTEQADGRASLQRVGRGNSGYTTKARRSEPDPYTIRVPNEVGCADTPASHQSSCARRQSGHGYQKPRVVIVGIRGAGWPALLLPLGRSEHTEHAGRAGNEDRTDVWPARQRRAATLPPRPIPWCR
jgi:hypothetical protein